MKNRILIIVASLIIVGLAVLAWAYYGSKTPASPSSSGLIRACPEAWYENRMPTITPDGEKPQPHPQYLIINGQRVELSQVDIEWVKKNCEVNQPSPVY